MSNILSPPLEIRHDRIDPLVLEAVRRIDAVARQHNTGFFLAGATAREVILRHVSVVLPGAVHSILILA